MISFKVIQNTLVEITTSNSFDAKTKMQAVNLTWKLPSIDFAISLVFMKNVMYRINQITETLQSPLLNIIDALAIIRSTVESLKKIQDEYNTMNQEINAGITFLRKVGNDDLEEEFQRKHWKALFLIRPESRNHRKGNASLVLSRRVYEAVEHVDRRIW